MKKYYLLLCLAHFFIFANSQDHPTSADSLIKKAFSHKGQGNYDSALNDFLKASKLYDNKGMQREFADAMINTSFCLVNTGKLHEADSVLNAMEKFCQQEFGENDTLLSDVFHNRGLMHFYAGQMKEALQFTEKAYSIRKNAFSPGHEKYMQTCNNLSTLYYYTGQTSKAIEHDKRIINELTNTVGELHPEVAKCYFNLGNSYYGNKNFDEAIAAYQKSLEIGKKVFKPNDVNILLAYFGLGTCYVSLSKFEKALIYQKKYASKIKKLHGINNRDYAAAINNIGVVHWHYGNYDSALLLMKRSLEIKENIIGKDHPDLGEAYLNLGTIFDEKGEPGKAINYYEKALKNYQLNFGENHIHTASVYNNLGISYQYKGEYELALEYFYKALKIKRDNLDSSDFSIKASLNNIGTIYFEKGDYQKSISLFKEGINEIIKKYGKDQLVLADSYTNIASSYESLGKYNNAITYNENSLDILNEKYNKKHIDIAITLYHLARCYHKKGQDSIAEKYFLQAISKAIESVGNHHNKLATILFDYSLFLHDNNRISQALEQNKKGMKANSKPKWLNSSYPPMAGIYNTYKMIEGISINALIQQKMYDSASNQQYLLNALNQYFYADTLINISRQNRKSMEDKLSLGKLSFDIYKGAVGLCNRLFQIKKDKKYLEMAFYFIEKSKGGVLLEALASSDAKQFAGIPDSLLEIEKKFKSDITFLYKKLAESPGEKIELKTRNKLFDLNRKYEAFIRKMEHDYPAYHQLKYTVNEATIADVQNRIDEKTLVVNYFSTDSLLYVFNIGKEHYMLYETSKDDDFDDFILMLRSEIIKGYYNAGAIFLSKLSNKVYKNVFPFKIPKDIENLVIIPDGLLSFIPFEALLTKAHTINLSDYSTYPFLVNEYNVSYSYSANLLYITLPKESSPNVEVTDIKDWLAFAPVFSDKSTGGLTLRTRDMLRQISAFQKDTLNTRGRLFNGAQITPLPGTEEEVKKIFNEFDSKGFLAQVQLNKNANEEFIKSGNLKYYKYLHIATHGFVNADKPELSGILLAQDSLSKEDGILFSGEIYNLQMNADLVVLSACETGLGKYSKGEGIIGLTRALLYAGSKNIIVSLWKVADNSTSILMTDFYDNLLKQKGQERNFSMAISEAKRKMIHSKKYAHPFYWSPFVLVGR